MAMRFGVCEWSFPVSNIAAIALASAAGFEGMQLSEAGGRGFSYPLSNDRFRGLILEAGEKYNIKFPSLNLGALLSEGTLNFPENTTEGEAAKESLRRGFDAAKKLGCNAVVVTVEPKTKEAKENVASHLNYAGTLSQETGITLTIECALPLPEIDEIIDSAPEDAKICMDLLNPYRFCTGDPHEQLRHFGADKIDHYHFKDSTKELFAPGNRGCVLLGTGDAGIAESAQIMKEIGANGWCISENYYHFAPMNDFSKDFADLAHKDLETMRNLFK